MRTFLRSLILLVLVVWVGGLLFFGAVVAPVAFESLLPMFPDPAVGLQVAGTMVRDSLTHLHDIGLFCGAYYPCDTTLHRAGDVADCRDDGLDRVFTIFRDTAHGNASP
jgi:hypothetical protein